MATERAIPMKTPSPSCRRHDTSPKGGGLYSPIPSLRGTVMSRNNDYIINFDLPRFCKKSTKKVIDTV